MTTAATTLLGLALPVTGELQGTWGDTVNNSITSLLDTAVAGTTTLSTDGDVTLTTTTLATNQARQAILLCSGARTALRTITAPAQSKIYTVINNTTGGFSVKLVGVGPTTGVTIVAGESALVAWNGSDFIKISNTAGGGTFTDLTVSNSLTLSGGTANGVLYLNGSKVATSGSALTFDGTNLGLGVTPSAWLSTRKVVQNGNAAFVSAPSVPAFFQLSANTYTDSGGTDRYISTAASTNYAQVNGAHQWFTAASGTTGNAISFTQAMTLDASGRLLISAGASAPNDASGFWLTNVSGIGPTLSGLNITFQTGGTGSQSERARIDSSGNFGLGVTPNTWTSGWRAFEIATSGSSVFSNGASSIGLGQGFYNNSGSKYAQSSYAVGGYQINAGVHSWLIAGVGTAGNAISFTTAMTLDASGRLALGATSILGGSNIASFTNVTSAKGVLAIQNTSTSGYSAVELYDNSGSQQGAMGWGNGSVAVTGAASATYLYSTGAITFLAGGTTERARIDSSGNFGLGVTPSAWGGNYKAIQVNSTGAYVSNGSNATGLGHNYYYDGTNNRYLTTGAANLFLMINNEHRWYNAASGTAGDAISFSQAMTLDASGNLLIGATSPDARIFAYSSTGTSFKALNPSNVAQLLIGYNNTSYNYMDADNNIFRSGNGTERARIDSSGNFNIGTAIADAGRLNINGVGGTSFPTSLYIETSASGTTDYALRIYNSGTTALFTIRTDGVVNTGAATNSPVNLTTANAANVYVGGASGTLYKSTSSRKYKRDIENTPRGLADLLKLRAVIYKQKTADVDGNIPDTVHGGLIAEEVHDAGLTEFVQYADDGTPDALAYGHMVSLCVKAIQEQQVLIQQLTARVAQLEAKGA